MHPERKMTWIHTQTSLSWFCWDTRGTGVARRSLITFPTCQVKKINSQNTYPQKEKGKEDTKQKQTFQIAWKHWAYLCCHSVHWCLTDLLVLEVLWALRLPSHQEVLPNRKMVRVEKSDIKKRIMQDMIAYIYVHIYTDFFLFIIIIFYPEALSLLPALVSPSLPWALQGLSLVGSTRRN